MIGATDIRRSGKGLVRAECDTCGWVGPDRKSTDLAARGDLRSHVCGELATLMREVGWKG